MSALRTPLLAGIAASFAMSALGPVAPDGFLGGLVASSLGVVVYLLAPVPRSGMEAALPTEMAPVAVVESRIFEEREAA